MMVRQPSKLGTGGAEVENLFRCPSEQFPFGYPTTIWSIAMRTVRLFPRSISRSIRREPFGPPNLRISGSTIYGTLTQPTSSLMLSIRRLPANG
jgi:hypothetical protein